MFNGIDFEEIDKLSLESHKIYLERMKKNEKNN
jgi:hypothetical protein